MKKYSPFIIGCALAGLSACKNNKSEHSFNVQGNISGMPKTVVYLEEIGLNNELKIADSTESNANGNFTLSGSLDKEQKMYRIKMGSKFILVINDQPEVKVKADWKDIEAYTVSGSAGSSSLRTLVGKMYAYDKTFAALHLAIDSISASPIAHDSLLLVAQTDFDKRMSEMRSYMKQYADTSRYLPVAILAALRVENLLNDQPFLEQFTTSLDKRFGNQTLVTDFKKLITTFGGSTAVKSSNIKLNSPAPEFSIKGINGSTVELKKYKGKYVLIDFWASWCPPCRKENPNVVAIYNTFKDKNFDILGISLDEDKEKWRAAIKEDQIAWTQTSELKGWKSSIVDLYGVESIPSNVLIDPSGNVVGINLMGEELKEKLDELLNVNSIKINSNK